MHCVCGKQFKKKLAMAAAGGQQLSTVSVLLKSRREKKKAKASFHEANLVLESIRPSCPKKRSEKKKRFFPLLFIRSCCAFLVLSFSLAGRGRRKEWLISGHAMMMVYWSCIHLFSSRSADAVFYFISPIFSLSLSLSLAVFFFYCCVFTTSRGSRVNEMPAVRGSLINWERERPTPRRLFRLLLSSPSLFSSHIYFSSLLYF